MKKNKNVITYADYLKEKLGKKLDGKKEKPITLISNSIGKHVRY